MNDSETLGEPRSDFRTERSAGNSGCCASVVGDLASEFQEFQVLAPAISGIEADKWDEDARIRYNLPALNDAMRDSVPVLKFLDWEISEVRRGFAETILPLNVNATNQYVTHQAALMLLAADYTGGIALSTLFSRVPVIGFHSMEGDFGAYMWGAKATIRWHRPSCGDLRCVAEVPPEKWAHIVRRFKMGRRVIETIPVRLLNEDLLVAEAEFTYWAQNSHALCHSPESAIHPHVLYDLKLKSSARLIAGLRALEQDKPESDRLFIDPLAARVAQKRGKVLASRFLEYMPQLQNMVAARTKILDETIADLERPYSIINLGCGLDTRPGRLDLSPHDLYELDLPAMLMARDAELPPSEFCCRRLVREAIDLRHQEVDEVIGGVSGFDFTLPMLITWEGGTMYFPERVVKRILLGISRLMRHPDSRLWFDFTSRQVVENTTELPEAEAFISGMRRMGESFIFGFGDLTSMLKDCGLIPSHVQPSSCCLKINDPIYSHYSFCLARSRI